MKKVLFFIAAVAAMLVSCAKETPEQTIDPEVNATVAKVTLHATVLDNETKVSTDNVGAYKWQADDAITVLNTDGTPYTFNTTEGGAEVDFNSMTFAGTLSTEAMYPQSDNHMSGKFYLESSYDWVADASRMPMLGTVNTGDNTVSFSAVGGVLKLILFNVPDAARKLVVTSATKQLTGEFTPSGSVIATADKGASNNAVTINFAAGHNTNMVFYIPMPTGSVGILTFEVKDDSDNVLFTKATAGSPTIKRNTILAAPGLNIAGGEEVEDAKLTNSQIISSSLTGSYTQAGSPVSITNTFGTWNISGMKGGNYKSSGNYYAQIRNNDNVSYIQLPSFANEIATVIVEGVCNTSETKYTGSIYFRSTADNDAEALATGTSVSAKDNVSLTIPAGNTTGYIMSSGACLISSITVVFSTGTPASVPVINVGSVTTTISAGNLNASISSVSLSNPVDGLGIVADYSADWIESAVVNEGRLNITASDYNHLGESRSANITLKATGATDKVVTVTQNPTTVPSPTLTATPGNATFSISWTADSKAKSYIGYYSASDISSDPTSGNALSITNDGSAYTATPSGAVSNGTTYNVYVIVNEVSDSYAAKYAPSPVWAKTTVKPSASNIVTFTLKTSEFDGLSKTDATSGITLTLGDHDYGSDPSVGSTYTKVYAGNTIRISGATFKKVEFTATSSGYIKTWSASDNTTCSVSGATMTWEKSAGASDITFENTATAQARITTVVITY